MRKDSSLGLKCQDNLVESVEIIPLLFLGGPKCKTWTWLHFFSPFWFRSARILLPSLPDLAVFGPIRQFSIVQRAEEDAIPQGETSETSGTTPTTAT